MEDIVLLMEKNSAFKNECIRMLFEQADNFQTALMLDYLQRTKAWTLECVYEYQEEQKKPEYHRPADAADVMRFQKMLAFIRERRDMDENAVHTYAETGLYKREMSGQCIRANGQLRLLDTETLSKMQALNTKLEEKNG